MWSSLFLQRGPENRFLHIYGEKGRHKWRMEKDFHDLASLHQCSALLFWESKPSATFTFSDWGSNLNKYSSLRLALMRMKEILFLGKFWRGRRYNNDEKRLRVLKRRIIHRGSLEKGDLHSQYPSILHFLLSHVWWWSLMTLLYYLPY